MKYNYGYPQCEQKRIPIVSAKEETHSMKEDTHNAKDETHSVKEETHRIGKRGEPQCEQCHQNW
jgi:hypothetical protein